MSDPQLLMMGAALAGFVVGASTFYFAVKYKAEISREAADFLILKIPILEEIRTNIRMKRAGLFIDEWEEFEKKRERLGGLVEPDVILHYAREYDIHYVGLEGDRDDKSWTSGKLAYATLTNGCKDGYNLWGYNVFLNPDLDTEKISGRLSRQLGEAIHPSEVQTFLFLHEIGHTPKAGNKSYFSALINHSIAGGKRSPVMRRQLRFLRSEIERYADHFALGELKGLRAVYGESP